MAKSEGDSGLMSSAGLVRYFESEDRNAINLDPKTVVAWGVLFGVLVQVLNAVGFGGEGTGTAVLGVVIAAFGGLTVGMVVRAAMQGEV
jgi:preprotein translocase subunit Sec61beta